MKKRPAEKPSISDLETAARRLARTKPQRKAFVKLLKQEPIVDAKELAKMAAGGKASYYEARRNFTDRTFQQLANGLRLALALSRSEEKLNAFYEHKFWDGKRPNQAKIMLHCLQFALPPSNNAERKLLSKYAAAIGWLVLEGCGPDDLRDGAAREGGLSACASKLAAWRRKRKKTASGEPDAVRGEKEEATAVPSVADATTNVVKLPVRFVNGLRRKVRDREPPADSERFWARIRHRGDRITITKIARGK
jgi:hypothetical protein